MTIAFSNYSPKIRKLSIFVPCFEDFILWHNLQLNKFKGVNFKYDNGFYEFQPGNLLRVLILKMAIVFLSNSSKKNSNTKFSLKTQKFFIFNCNFEWTKFYLVNLNYSKCYCYSCIDKNFFFSNRRWKIVFYSRQILSGIAFFQVAFSIYHRKLSKEK